MEPNGHTSARYTWNRLRAILTFKHIHRYVLSGFLSTFFVTFFGAVFVLLIQFAVRYMDDLIGKGLDAIVILRFMYYVALTLVPTALPLAILVGSLMTFGNFAEKLELLSMKAAGISLFRIMKTLILLVGVLSIGSFYFANHTLPQDQVKMWNLLFSIRRQSPEVEIPAGAFYGGIPGRNLYVARKQGTWLYDVIIYDYEGGFEKMSIMRADSGVIRSTPDKMHFVLDLYSGESFDSNIGSENESGKDGIKPYRREQFGYKQIIIDYDANFNENENTNYLTRQYVSKNAEQLQEVVDSINISMQQNLDAATNELVGERYLQNHTVDDSIWQTTPGASSADVYRQLTAKQRKNVIMDVIDRLRSDQRRISTCEADQRWLRGERNRNAIERERKFTLAVACFIFLFIGAPLGAIIKKGGMGMPLVMSILMFIVYYIIDNTGYKMAREGIWPVVAGMWLSTAVLFPLGIWLTWMAATENTPKGIEKIITLLKRLRKKRIFASSKQPAAQD
ncbi:MAG: LptF/LptG family permease [Paludibacteraceae bacterium]|nr:LptF/LptG family permease [Paludibacteraceae bacterium]